MTAVEAATEALGDALPIPGGLTNLEYADSSYLRIFGYTLTVDDSWWDIASDDWYWFDNDDDGEDSAGDSTDASGNPYPRFDPATGKVYGTYMYGGRIFVGITPAYVPMQELQKLKHIGMRQCFQLQKIMMLKNRTTRNYQNRLIQQQDTLSNDKTSNVELMYIQ